MHKNIMYFCIKTQQNNINIAPDVRKIRYSLDLTTK